MTDPIIGIYTCARCRRRFGDLPTLAAPTLCPECEAEELAPFFLTLERTKRDIGLSPDGQRIAVFYDGIAVGHFEPNPPAGHWAVTNLERSAAFPTPGQGADWLCALFLRDAANSK